MLSRRLEHGDYVVVKSPHQSGVDVFLVSIIDDEVFMIDVMEGSTLLSYNISGSDDEGLSFVEDTIKKQIGDASEVTIYESGDSCLDDIKEGLKNSHANLDYREVNGIATRLISSGTVLGRDFSSETGAVPGYFIFKGRLYCGKGVSHYIRVNSLSR